MLKITFCLKKNETTGDGLGLVRTDRDRQGFGGSPDADSEDEVISVCLTTCSESRRDTLNLVRHPENKGKRVAVFGVQETYLKLPGIRHIDALEFPAG